MKRFSYIAAVSLCSFILAAWTAGCGSSSSATSVTPPKGVAEKPKPAQEIKTAESKKEATPEKTAEKAKPCTHGP